MGAANGSIQSADRDRNDLKMYSFAQNHHICDSSSEDYSVPDAYQKCRYAEVDMDGAINAGIVKIDYNGDNGQPRTVVITAVSGSPIRYPNITKVYRYYTGETPCTTKVFDADGSSVVGIRLCL